MDRVSAISVHGDPAADPRTFDSSYTYDPAGNLASVTDPFGRTTTYTYDALNRLSTMTRPNGVTTTHTYDPRGRPLSILHTTSTGAVLASVTYERAASGEPTRVTREDGSYVLIDYDPALRVARERYLDATDTLQEELSYTYDADGNRTSRTRTLPPAAPVVESYIYGPGSELLRVEVGGVVTQAFTYDAAGRVTRIVRDGHDRALEYDADDHAIAIEDSSTSEREEFAFDAEGRRTGRRRLVAGVLAAALTMAIAPGPASGLESPQLTADATGSAQTVQVFDGEHAMARYDAGTTEPVYYLRDAMGSVIGVVDHAGTASARIHYDGFGNERGHDGVLADLPAEGAPRFQGMWSERGGLYYVRARQYDPGTGRFLSRDPAEAQVRQPESAYAYVFANGNPWMGRDPTGRFTLGDTQTASTGAGIIDNIGRASALRAFLWFAASVAGAAVGTAAAEVGPHETLLDIQAALGLLVFNRTRNVRHACRALGISRADCRRAIHRIKKAWDLRGDDDIEIDTITGDVFDHTTGEWIGNLYDE